jgi:CheY-like chemotaxis protein
MSKPLALVIEDDPYINKIFSITLKTDFEVESFATGDSAITRLAQVEPALVVLDLHLPGASGEAILSNIRNDTRLTKTRVILSTADERQAEFLHDKADVVLLKPVSPSQLKLLAMRLCRL